MKFHIHIITQGNQRKVHEKTFLKQRRVTMSVISCSKTTQPIAKLFVFALFFVFVTAERTLRFPAEKYICQLRLISAKLIIF
jgi:hypothetical protein